MHLHFCFWVRNSGPETERHLFPRPFKGTESESHLVMSDLCDPMDYIVHRILQNKILEWVPVPFSRGSSQPRNQSQVSHTAGRFFTSRATREVLWSEALPTTVPGLLHVQKFSLFTLRKEASEFAKSCRALLFIFLIHSYIMMKMFLHIITLTLPTHFWQSA